MVDNNTKIICHYCGEVILNPLSEYSNSYIDATGNWFCSFEEYLEYLDANSIF